MAKYSNLYKGFVGVQKVLNKDDPLNLPQVSLPSFLPFKTFLLSKIYFPSKNIFPPKIYFSKNNIILQKNMRSPQKKMHKNKKTRSERSNK